MINFTYGGVNFTLDTSKGELLGDKNTPQYHHLISIIGKSSKYDDKTVIFTLGGEPSLPFDCINITNPYKNPDQFALMVVLSEAKNNWHLSDEMKAYLPYYKESEGIKELRTLGIKIYY